MSIHKPRVPRLVLVPLLFFGLAAATISAEPPGRGPVLGQKLPSASDTSLQVDGQWGGAYQAVALSTDGSLAYVGSGARLWILRIGDGGTSGAEPLGVSAPLPGPIRDLALDGTVLYVAAQTGGVWAMDVTDPAQPEMLGIEPGIPEVINMVADGEHRVHLARGNLTMTSLDFADPRSPQALGCAVFEDGAGVWDIAVNGNMAYLAMNEQGLRALDLFDPLAPVIRSALPAIDGQPLFVTAVAESGGLVLAADGPRLRVIDWQDPDRPLPLATLDLPDEDIKTLSVLGRTAFLAAQSFSDSRLFLHRVDLADPRQPVLAQTIDLGILEDGLGAPDGYALALSQQDRRMAAAAGSQGLKVIDRNPSSESESWTAVAGLALAPWAESVDARWQLSAAGASGLWFLGDRWRLPGQGGPNLLEPVVDSPGQALSGGGDPRDPDLYYLADGSGGLRGYVQPPLTEWVWPHLAEVSEMPELQAARRFALFADSSDARSRMLYVVDQLSGLHVVQATGGSTTPAHALIDLGSLDLGFDLPEDVAVDIGAQRLYVAHGSAVSVFGIGDPTRPTRLATIDTPGFASGVAVGPGGLLGVADGEAGLSWYDMTDPARPLPRGSVDTGGTAVRVAFDAAGSRAFVADREGGLQAIDLGIDPPSIVAGFNLPFPVVDVSLGADEAVWIAARAGGVYRLRLGEAASPPATVSPTPRRTATAHATPMGHGTPTGNFAARIWLPSLLGGAGVAPVHP